MKCPACGNDLTPYPAGPITVDVCATRCGGIWFDAFELPRVEEMRKPESAGLLKLAPHGELPADPGGKRTCPRCEGVVMMRHYFSAQRKIVVDECPGCGGFWLDAGELAGVREETRAQKAMKGATAAGLTRLVLQAFLSELTMLETSTRQNPAAVRRWQTLGSAVRALASGS